jgi:hypothetical protein
VYHMMKIPHLFDFLLYSLSEFFRNSSYTTSSLTHIFLLSPAVMFACKNVNPGQLSNRTFLSLWSKLEDPASTMYKFSLQIYIMSTIVLTRKKCRDMTPTTIQSTHNVLRHRTQNISLIGMCFWWDRFISCNSKSSLCLV